MKHTNLGSGPEKELQMQPRIEAAVVRSILHLVESSELDGIRFYLISLSLSAPPAVQHSHRSIFRQHEELLALNGHRATQLCEPLLGHLHSGRLGGIVVQTCEELRREDVLDGQGAAANSHPARASRGRFCTERGYEWLVLQIVEHVVQNSCRRYMACALWNRPVDGSSVHVKSASSVHVTRFRLCASFLFVCARRNLAATCDFGRDGGRCWFFVRSIVSSRCILACSSLTFMTQ